MDAALPIALVGVVLAIAIAIGVLVWRAEQARRRALASWAGAHGWSYVGSDSSWVDRLAGPPFGKGQRRRAENVLSGTHAGLAAAAFDYAFTTYTTDSQGRPHSQDHRFAVVAMRLPVPLGWVEVTGEGLAARLVKTVGGQDVELESAEFNRRFRVRAHDAKLASDVLPPRTMEQLLSAAPTDWRLQDGYAVAWSDVRLNLVELTDKLSVLGLVVAGVPRFVWRQHGYDPVSPA